MIDNAAAEGFRPLAGFCCGDCSTSPTAYEVNMTAGRLFKGGPYDQGGAMPQQVVLLLDQDDSLLGIASVRPEGAVRLDPAVELVTPEGGDPPELQAFVAEDNTRSHGPMTNVGFERGQNNPMQLTVPLPMRGQVAPPQRVFEITLPSGNVHIGGQELWRRPPGRELPLLSPDVYTGPSQPIT